MSTITIHQPLSRKHGEEPVRDSLQLHSRKVKGLTPVLRPESVETHAPQLPSEEAHVSSVAELIGNLLQRGNQLRSLRAEGLFDYLDLLRDASLVDILNSRGRDIKFLALCPKRWEQPDPNPMTCNWTGLKLRNLHRLTLDGFPLQAAQGMFHRADLPNLTQYEFVWRGLDSSTTMGHPVVPMLQALASCPLLTVVIFRLEFLETVHPSGQLLLRMPSLRLPNVRKLTISASWQGKPSSQQILPKQALYGCSRLETLKLCQIRCPDGLVSHSLKRISFVEKVQLSNHRSKEDPRSGEGQISPRAVTGLRQTLTAFMESSPAALSTIKIYLIEDCINSSVGTVALAHLCSQLTLPPGWKMKVREPVVAPACNGACSSAAPTPKPCRSPVPPSICGQKMSRLQLHRCKSA
eukprot:jgi/Botrbrau1/12660/Bobra.67_1s0025.1